MSRDNFSAATKTKLAQRAGYRCSFPGCNATTIGPSDESDDATSSTGTAAHISAAASGPGSRRYDPNITPTQRSSIENGIWCCRSHGTLIDTDEETYSVAMLKQWRAITEKKAQLRQALGDIDFGGQAELVDIGLAPDETHLNEANKSSKIIGDAIKHSYLKEVWGEKISSAARDFLIESTRNFLTHASAKNVIIRIAPSSITVEHDGDYYDWRELEKPNSGRGGGMAYRALLSATRANTFTTKKLNDGRFSIQIPLVRDARMLPSINPCAISISHEYLTSQHQPYFSAFEGCDKIHVVYDAYASYSDLYLCQRILNKFMDSGKIISLILPEASDEVFYHFKNSLTGFEVSRWAAT